MVPLASEAAVEPLFAEPTPLVLKDGRIAVVSVHRIPFAIGEEVLDEATASQLRLLIEPLATDCFLTAQAIGHVDPGVTRDGDTLNAHRLARARADHIQAELASLGMPQPAVASVWDWQFLVEKSQVTLWIFSLHVGDDCEGAPLPQQPIESAEALDGIETATASDEPPPPPRELVVPGGVSDQADQAEADGATVVSELAPPDATPDEIARRPDPVEGGAAAADLEFGAADLPARRAAAGGELAAGASAAAAAVIRDPLATAAVAPVSPAPTDRPSSADSAEVEDALPTTTVASIDDATRTTGASAGGPADLAITFAVNSSFFPSGAVPELRRFLETLPASAPVEIELSGAVGTGDVRGASAEEAERYNAWMAERRIERVAEWLDGNAGGRQLSVTERLVENDSSRQVRLRASVAE